MAELGKSETLLKLESLGAEELAQIVLDMAVPAGSQAEWDSGTIEEVLAPLEEPFRQLDIPWIGNTGEDDSALRFWEALA